MDLLTVCLSWAGGYIVGRSSQARHHALVLADLLGEYGSWTKASQFLHHLSGGPGMTPSGMTTDSEARKTQTVTVMPMPVAS
jgi:hypothetical protein